MLIGTVWYIQGFRNLPALVSLVPTLVLLFALVWALGTLAGFANVYFQDTQHLCEVGFQILLYMTPILYKRDMLERRGFGWLVDFNPLSAFLDLIRDPVLKAQHPSAFTLAVACLTVAVAMCGLFVFGLPILTSFGIAGLGVVLLCMAAAVTLLPATLAAVGRRIPPTGSCS